MWLSNKYLFDSFTTTWPSRTLQLIFHWVSYTSDFATLYNSAEPTNSNPNDILNALINGNCLLQNQTSSILKISSFGKKNKLLFELFLKLNLLRLL